MSRPLFKNICDELVFTSIFKKHSKNLYQFLFYRYGEVYGPKDKTQEAFIKLWKNCKKVTPDKAKAYLFKVANNLMLNEIKHQKVVLKYRQTKPTSHTNEDPEFMLEEKEYMQRLQKAISTLTEPQRVAFLLNRIEDKKHKEIAEILGISVKAVEKRIYGALKKLRKEIKNI